MASHPALRLCFVVTAVWTLACAHHPDDPELELVGVWSRDAGDGVVAYRQFTGGELFTTYTNSNYVAVDGGAPVLYSEARYWVFDDLLQVDTTDLEGFPLPTYDDIVRVRDDRLVLHSRDDDQDYEYVKIDALPQ